MKIEIKVKSVGSEHVWSEMYNIDNGLDPEEYAQKLVNKFNNSLRAGEKPRELVNVSVIDDVSKPIHFHDWHKTNGFTLRNRFGYYDAMKCSLCEITGKRYGIGGNIIRDSKYKAKIYDTCEGTIIQLEKIKSKKSS